MGKRHGRSGEILFITTALRMGGVQTFLLNYIPFLIQSGVRVSIAIQTKERLELHSAFEELGCHIYSITPVTESHRRYMKDLRKIFKSNPDICAVYDNQNFLNIFSLWAARKCGIKVRISHSHSNYATSSVKRKLQRLIFKMLLPLFATHYFACSQASAKWQYGRRFKSKRCYVISNAIDDKRFLYNPLARQELRTRLHLDGCFVALHVGMFTDAKNHAFLLKLFAEYVKIHQNARLVLCGDGPLRKRIEALIETLGIQDYVLMQGMVLDTEKYLSAADVFLFPSKYEGAGISVVEAQAAGINGVVSNAVPRDVIFNENLRSCAFDTYEWIAAIEELRVSEVDRRATGENASKTEFSLSQTGVAFANTIKGILRV